jgi:hypothetical protein
MLNNRRRQIAAITKVFAEQQKAVERPGYAASVLMAAMMTPNEDETEEVDKLLDTFQNNFDENAANSQCRDARSMAALRRKAADPDSPSLKEALSGDEAAEWREAIDSEDQQMDDKDVFEWVTSIPAGKEVIPAHYILKQKRDPRGNRTKKKARLVAGGHRQSEASYGETYAPTANMVSIKVILQLAASQGLLIRSLDVGGAYLNADIDRELYLIIPSVEKDGPVRLARLRKSLYGLKQAGHLWYHHLRESLEKFGYAVTKHDQCCFTKTEADGTVTMLAIHVDDLLIASADISHSEALLTHLRSIYSEVSDSDGSSHLGLSLDRDAAGSIKVTQPGLLKKFIEFCGLTDGCSASITPVSAYDDPSSYSDEDSQPVDSHMFLRGVGMLLYLTHSRLDLLFASSLMSSAAAAPTVRDWRKLVRVGRYLLGTTELGIIFRSDDPVELHGFCDASYATNSDMRSHTGVAVHMGFASACIYAASIKQKLVALSSTEAEMEALKSITTLLVWIRGLLGDFGLEQISPALVYEDNTAAVHLASKPGKWGRTRHFAVRYEYVKSQVKENVLEIHWCPTGEMVADILTKPLASAPFLYLRPFLLGELPHFSLHSSMHA